MVATAERGPMAANGESLGARVRRLRGQKKLTQQQVANAAGLALSMITQIEQGRIKDPRWSTIQALADGLGVPVSELRAPEDLPEGEG